jgi:hypothetical protein
MSHFMNILRVGVEVFHTDGQTDCQTRHDGVNSRFSKFCERALKVIVRYFSSFVFSQGKRTVF